MREKVLTIPEIAIIAGTRAAFGFGLGLLLADKLPRDIRRGAGCALLAVGAMTTIPILVGLFARHDSNGAPESA